MENMNVRLAPSMKMALGDARESTASFALGMTFVVPEDGRARLQPCSQVYLFYVAKYEGAIAGDC